MFTIFLQLVTGFFILIKSADWLVDGATSLAKRLGVSSFIVGLTVVAFGTTMPELAVNVLANLRGSSDLVIGNILGSNISNILLILGVAALIYPLRMTSKTLWREMPFSLFAIMVLVFVANDALIDASAISIISRVDGFILLAFMAIFLVYIFEISKNRNSGLEDLDIERRSWQFSTILILSGIVGLALGSKWLVDGAVYLARFFDVSEALIGLTIVAIGTSLPELTTSATAAYRHDDDIAIGNVIGANIFNIFWILGLSAVISPVVFDVSLNFDILIGAVATGLLFAVMFVGQKMVLERWQGAVFIGVYLLYIVILIVRG